MNEQSIVFSIEMEYIKERIQSIDNVVEYFEEILSEETEKILDEEIFKTLSIVFIHDMEENKIARTIKFNINLWFDKTLLREDIELIEFNLMDQLFDSLSETYYELGLIDMVTFEKNLIGE